MCVCARARTRLCAEQSRREAGRCVGVPAATWGPLSPPWEGLPCMAQLHPYGSGGVPRLWGNPQPLLCTPHLPLPCWEGVRRAGWLVALCGAGKRFSVSGGISVFSAFQHCRCITLSSRKKLGNWKESYLRPYIHKYTTEKGLPEHWTLTIKSICKIY